MPPRYRAPTPLALGQSLDATIWPDRYNDYFVQTLGGESLLVQVTPLAGSNELWIYGKAGDVPIYTRFDLGSQIRTPRGTYDALISPAQPGAYVFSVYGRNVAATGGRYSILAQAVTRYLSDIAPRIGGNTGTTTLRMTGLGLAEAGITARLVRTGVPDRIAAEVTGESATALLARFDLTGAAAGIYDVVLTWPGGHAETLPAAFEITPGVGPKLETRITAPESVRPGRQYMVHVDYSNTGDADLLAPLLRITADNAQLKLPEQADFQGSSIQLYGINDEAPANVLPPGTGSRISLVFMPSSSGGQVQFTVSELRESGGAAATAAPASESLDPEIAAFERADSQVQQNTIDVLPASIIHNTRFVDTEGLSLVEIQKVLEGLPGALKNYTLNKGGMTYLAAQLLSNARTGEGYTINPRVLLVLLEMSTRLVMDPNSQPTRFNDLRGPDVVQVVDLGEQLRLLSEMLAGAYRISTPKTGEAGSIAVTSILSSLNPALSAQGLAFVTAEQFVQTYQRMFGVDPRTPLQVPATEVEPFLVKPFINQFGAGTTLFGAVNSFFDHNLPVSRTVDGKLTLFTGDSPVGTVSSCDYGVSCYDGHSAIDYNTSYGDIHPAQSGAVLIACDREEPGCNGALGNFLVVQHASGYGTLYGHLFSIGLNPRSGAIPTQQRPWREGDNVTPADVLGQSGNTGSGSFGPHLHFETFASGITVDPFGWWKAGTPSADPWADDARGTASTWLWQTGTIADEKQPSFERFTHSHWFVLPGQAGYAANAWYALAGTTKRNWAIWGLKVPATGRYHVQAYIPKASPKDHPWTGNAKYSIRYKDEAGALEATDAVGDQSRGNNNWITLNIPGAADPSKVFGTGRITAVILSDQTDNSAQGTAVAFDAIRLFGLSGKAQGPNRVELHWTDVSDNGRNADTGFKIYRDYAEIATVSGVSTTSYVDNSAKCGVTYRYQVRSYNSSGQSDPTNTITLATPTNPLCQFIQFITGQFRSAIIRPIDPNEKAGPVGYGATHIVGAGEELAYTVYFENMPAATAPVQELLIEDALDPNLDWASLALGEVAYGGRVVAAALGAMEFTGQDFPGPADIAGTFQGQARVDITAVLDPDTGKITWTMKVIDTATGQFPEDAEAGFLPPENGTGRGQGHVTFSIRPRASVADGTVITNSASIVFDTNDPIATNMVSNTIGSVLADLALVNAASPEPAAVGGELVYQLKVTNHGPLAATDVVVTDTLPAGVTFLRVEASQGSCSGTRTLLCSLGTLQKGGVATVTIRVKPLAAGMLENAAGVSSSTPDPRLNDNTAIVHTTVTAPAERKLFLPLVLRGR